MKYIYVCFTILCSDNCTGCTTTTRSSYYIFKLCTKTRPLHYTAKPRWRQLPPPQPLPFQNHSNIRTQAHQTNVRTTNRQSTLVLNGGRRRARASCICISNVRNVFINNISERAQGTCAQRAHARVHSHFATYKSTNTRRLCVHM